MPSSGRPVYAKRGTFHLASGSTVCEDPEDGFCNRWKAEWVPNDDPQRRTCLNRAFSGKCVQLVYGRSRSFDRFLVATPKTAPRSCKRAQYTGRIAEARGGRGWLGEKNPLNCSCFAGGPNRRGCFVANLQYLGTEVAGFINEGIDKMYARIVLVNHKRGWMNERAKRGSSTAILKEKPGVPALR